MKQAAQSASPAAAELLEKLPGSWQPWLQAPGYPVITVNPPAGVEPLALQMTIGFLG